MKKFLNYIWKCLTMNRCDTCELTNDEIYVTEYFMEAGSLQCKECIEKEKFVN